MTSDCVDFRLLATKNTHFVRFPSVTIALTLKIEYQKNWNDDYAYLSPSALQNSIFLQYYVLLFAIHFL